jgi:23S rRNA (adenine2503-C2)-methyltransferase
MGCVFCATGMEGIVRNLTGGEILEEVLQLQRLLAADERLSHVVVMGMGEPLLNLDALLPALATVSGRQGLDISVRRITISTVGLPAGIRRLAHDNCQYHLAVSLHAANDALRNELVPANRGFGIAAILAAADEYFELTGRRVTFEYVLLADVNDRPEHARQLLQLLRGRPALINVIPYNPVPTLPYRRPSSAATARFVEILAHGGLNVNIRHRKGDRIGAACGQLRRSEAGQ